MIVTILSYGLFYLYYFEMFLNSNKYLIKSNIYWEWCNFAYNLYEDLQEEPEKNPILMFIMFRNSSVR